LSLPRVEPLPLRLAWLVLVVVVVAELMDLIDTSVANLAGPSIREDLGGGPMTLQWVLSAYTAAFALGLVTSGRLGDLLGRRRLFLIGMAGFTVASLACGLATGPEFLIVARVFQGLFGSVTIPQGMALVLIVFPPEHLRKALTPFGPIMGPTRCWPARWWPSACSSCPNAAARTRSSRRRCSASAASSSACWSSPASTEPSPRSSWSSTCCCSPASAGHHW
jgi:hypothetical protein